MRSISEARWNAFAGYCRHPLAAMLMREVAWFESPCGSIIATIALDTDGKFSAQLLAPDRLERFRWIETTAFRDTPEEVVTDLHDTIKRLLPSWISTATSATKSGSQLTSSSPLLPRIDFIQVFARSPPKRGLPQRARSSVQ